MQTLVKLSPQQIEQTYGHWGNHYRRQYWRGVLLRENSDFMQYYRDAMGKRQAGPLTPQQVEEVTKEQIGQEAYCAERSAEQIKEDLTEVNTATMSPRFQYAYLLQEVLRRRPDVRSVANIGARVDLWSAYLAPRFPQVQFISVDFQPRLAQHNSLLPQQPNWTFMSGYWRDLIRDRKLQADMYFSISTTVLMNNRELNVYLDQLAGHAKVVCFCEGWWARSDTIHPKGVIRPEDIPKERPYCGGQYANYHHNYIAKLEERGFTIELSQVLHKEDQFNYLQIVATKP